MRVIHDDESSAVMRSLFHLFSGFSLYSHFAVAFLHHNCLAHITTSSWLPHNSAQTLDTLVVLDADTTSPDLCGVIVSLAQ